MVARNGIAGRGRLTGAQLELAEYEELAVIEDRHWYYRWRRDVLADVIRKHVIPGLNSSSGSAGRQPLRILDIGCGTGGTTALFSSFGKVDGLEPHDVARRHLQLRHPGISLLPQAGVDALPEIVNGSQYDLGAIIGVLYHRNIPDPRVALQRIASCIRPGGYLIWNDAAFAELARHHDLRVHAARRFHPREMREHMEAAGFDVVFQRNLLGWSYPVALLMAWRDRLRKAGAEVLATEQSVPSRLVTGILMAVCKAEWALGNLGLRPPRGVNHLIIGCKRR